MSGTKSKTGDSWETFQRLVEEMADESGKSSFWAALFGVGGESSGVFFDAEGNDRTVLIKGLVARLEQTEQRLSSVAERVAVLERIVVTDEAKLSAEIENLRGGGPRRPTHP